MMRSIFRLALGVGLFLAVLAGGPGSASAHGMGTSHPPVRGILIDVQTGNLTVQTQQGPVRVPFDGGTYVVRTVAGSTADLSPGISVYVQLSKDGSAITAISIPPPGHNGQPSDHHPK